jgi:hypothetical protein
MTDARHDIDIDGFIAIRKEGLTIDPSTAEVSWRYAQARHQA